MKKLPQAFDDRSFELDGLGVDSAADRVALSGSTDITRDQAGLEKAKRLVQYLNGAIKVLEKELSTGALPDVVAVEKPVVKANPFPG
jgi:hypothetical protein